MEKVENEQTEQKMWNVLLILMAIENEFAVQMAKLK
jgi:hypothetical protein